MSDDAAIRAAVLARLNLSATRTEGERRDVPGCDHRPSVLDILEPLAVAVMSGTVAWLVWHHLSPPDVMSASGPAWIVITRVWTVLFGLLAAVALLDAASAARGLLRSRGAGGEGRDA